MPAAPAASRTSAQAADTTGRAPIPRNEETRQMSTRNALGRATSPGARRWFIAGVGAAAMLVVGAAHAQSTENFPNRPIRILVPYQPGGATDITARLIASKLPDVLGQQVLVENRPGAGGNIAVDATAAAAPDGYTLLVGNVSTNAINETTTAATLKSKPSRDLAGVTNVTEIPHTFLASGQVQAGSIKDFLSMAKAQPGKLNFASVGPGTYPHLDMMSFMKAAGIDMVHVPYKGGAGQVLPALISNETQVSFLNLSSALPHVRAGRVKVLAVTTSQRHPELPDVPTMAEQGFAGIGTNAWQGLFAPAATPPAVLAKLHAAVAQVAQTPDLKAAFTKQMMIPVISKSPQEFTEFMRAETRKWAEFVVKNNIKID